MNEPNLPLRHPRQKESVSHCMQLLEPLPVPVRI